MRLRGGPFTAATCAVLLAADGAGAASLQSYVDMTGFQNPLYDARTSTCRCGRGRAPATDPILFTFGTPVSLTFDLRAEIVRTGGLDVLASDVFAESNPSHLADRVRPVPVDG